MPEQGLCLRTVISFFRFEFGEDVDRAVLLKAAEAIGCAVGELVGTEERDGEMW